MNSDYRRFIPIGDKEKLDKFEALMAEKNLSKEDVILILQAVKLNPCIFPHNLTDIESVDALIDKLKKHEGVTVIPLGLYQGYELKGKYGNPDITSGTVILIRQEEKDNPTEGTALDVLTSEQLQMLGIAVKEKIPVLITGNRHYPTGKSFLCEFLRERGIDVREEYELNNESIQDSGENDVYFTIVLNKKLDLKKL
ncbi:MAG: hypothetical protein ACOCNL_15185 [Acetivibrio ethanolgignens]